MIFKIDLEKAYNKVSWNFLFDTLDSSWIALIMSCVTNVKTAILGNGETLEELSPGRGLRQGIHYLPTFLLFAWKDSPP